MTLGSLFDGSGTMPLVATMCGIEPVWASEIEKFPIEVTKYHFPKMQHFGDITKLDGATLPPIDILAGGSPCQNLSVAGNRQGLAGSESSLFLEQIRLIKEMRKATNGKYPRFCIWENVDGARNCSKGKDFYEVLNQFVKVVKGDDYSIPEPPADKSGKIVWGKAGTIVGDNFSIAWRLVDAARGFGVPQRRRRIYLVADFGCGGNSAAEILLKRESLPWYPSEGFGAWKGIAGDSREGTQEAGKSPVTVFGISSKDSNGFKSSNPHSGIYEADTARTLDLNGGNPTCNQGGMMVVETYRKTGHPQNSEQGQGWEQTDINDTLNVYDQGEVRTPTLVVEGQKQESPDVIGFDCYNQAPTGDVAKPLTHAATDSDHIPVVFEKQKPQESPDAIGFDGYNQTPTGDVSMTLTNGRVDAHHIPTVFEKKNTEEPIAFEPGAASRVGGHIYTDGKSGTLRANAGDNQQAVVYAFDGYNGAINDKVQPTLGVNCGMSTGRNGVIEAAGFCTEHSAKSRSIGYEEETSPTLRAGVVPAAIVLNDQGGSQMSVSENVTGTLRAQEHGHQPLVMEAVAIEGNGARPSHQGSGWKDDGTSFTLNTIEQHGVAYALDRASFNQGKNAQYDFKVEEEVNSTLVARGPSAVAQPAYSSSKESRFTDVSTEQAGTLVATDYKEPPMVSHPGGIPVENHPSDGRIKLHEDGVCQTLRARMGTGGGNEPMVLESAEREDPTYSVDMGGGKSSSVISDMGGGKSSSVISEEMSPTLTCTHYGAPVINDVDYVVRRLTPHECARLQGFPSDWCDPIPHSDSAEYKLWGNGMALPCALYVMIGIAEALQKEKENNQ